MLRSVQPREEVDDWVADEGRAFALAARLSARFWQPQDTLNERAEFITRAAELLEGVPLADYEAATDRVAALSDVAPQTAFWPPYNLFGRFVLRWGSADYGMYARRVGDIEGVRRAALAAVRLHEDEVKADDIPKSLAESEFHSPYDGQPFAWDEAESAVVFHGLQPGKRGMYRIG